MKNKIQLFEEEKVRTVWDDESEVNATNRRCKFRKKRSFEIT